MCVCVCACARARVCMCVRACARAFACVMYACIDGCLVVDGLGERLVASGFVGKK